MDKLTTDGWRFTASENDNYVPILHDCIATRIEIAGRELRLFFPEGFRLLPNDPHNPYDTPLPTKAGLLVFTLFFEPDELFQPDDMVRMEVFHDYWLRPYRLFRRSLPLFTVRKKPTLARLTEKINSRKWKLEFYDKYKHYEMGYLYEGVLYETTRRYHEFRFEIDCRDARYYWNDVSDEPERQY